MGKQDKVKYALSGCDRGVEQANNNIKTFEDAIEKEYETIRSLKKMKQEIIRKDMEHVVKEVIENDDSK